MKFDLTRKARYIGGGHKTKVLAAMTYSSVVSRDSVPIMFLIAALNDLNISDIGNAYLNAETRERLWFRVGTEWSKHHSINYNYVRECVAAGILFVHKVNSAFNLSEILTKCLPREARVRIRQRIMFCETD